MASVARGLGWVSKGHARCLEGNKFRVGGNTIARVWVFSTGVCLNGGGEAPFTSAGGEKDYQVGKNRSQYGTKPISYLKGGLSAGIEKMVGKAR